MKKKKIKTVEELLQVVEHCMKEEPCCECRYFGEGNGSCVFGCFSSILQAVHDFLTCHKALLKEAERKAEEDGRY